MGVRYSTVSGEAKSRLRQLAISLKDAPFHVRVVDDILPYKHTKLMYNAAISPLAAAAGLDNGDLLRLPRARRLFFDLLRENYAILSRAGVPLGKVRPLRPSTVAWILRRPWVAHALAWAFYPSLRGSYCSMSMDGSTMAASCDWREATRYDAQPQRSSRICLKYTG